MSRKEIESINSEFVKALRKGPAGSIGPSVKEKKKGLV